MKPHVATNPARLYHDLKIGEQLHELTVVSQVEGRWWLFKCTCGVRKKLDGTRVLRGTLRHCGDLRRHDVKTGKLKEAP